MVSITDSQQTDIKDFLLNVVLKDSSWSCQAEAVKSITDEDVLKKIAANEKYPHMVRKEAIKLITSADFLEQLFQRQLTIFDRVIANTVLKNVTDEEVLAQAALTPWLGAAQITATELILNNKHLFKIFTECGNKRQRLIVIKKISDVDILKTIFTSTNDNDEKEEAVKALVALIQKPASSTNKSVLNFC